jgi:hypothetical protein
MVVPAVPHASTAAEGGSVTALVVLTCARDGEQPFVYLDDTLRQIEAERAAGVDVVEPTIVCDHTASDNRPDIPIGWTLESFGRPPGTLRGNKWAYWAALATAERAGTDDALILEDDLEFAPNALRRMALFPVPADLAFVMFFAPAILQAPKMFPGLYRVPAPVICCQAIKYSRAGLRRLLDWQSSLGFEAFVESDQSLDRARAELALKYGAHCPELVQHVGATSVANPGEGLEYDFRRAKTFARRLDSMALFARDELYR